MAQCITCGSELHPDRAKKYNYCMAPACQEKNLKGLTMVAVGVNKAADNEQGLRPQEIADKLGLSTYIVTQIILSSSGVQRREEQDGQHHAGGPGADDEVPQADHHECVTAGQDASGRTELLCGRHEAATTQDYGGYRPDPLTIEGPEPIVGPGPSPPTTTAAR